MAGSKIEGTFRLDGLLEGPLFSDEDEGVIGDFVKRARKAGLNFHAVVDEGRFSLLADTAVVETGSGGEPAHVRVAKYLNELLENYSPEECMKLMSTLRSVEYIAGYEIQILYGIRPDGTAAMEQRTVRAETVRRAEPAHWRTKVKAILLLVIVLCVGIGVSAIFVPYRQIAAHVLEKAKPFRIQDFEVDTGAYGRFFRIERLELDRSREIIVIVCRQSERYPDTEAQLNELWKESSDSVSERLALEALMRNCVRCEFFGRDGDFEFQRLCYMHRHKGDKDLFSIVIPFRRDIRRVKISY